MAQHTVVLSDLHLADAEPPHPRNPLWKRFKRREFFIDEQYASLLAYLDRSIGSPTELVLNGDIFDFDSITVIPRNPVFSVSWLERKRGLSSEEAKSRFKIRLILDHHPVWVEATRRFVAQGHELVFVVGNHDMELHWPGVQTEILSALQLTEEERARVRFCEWFYISEGDTLIEHGNQYDAYSLSSNPINPLIRKGSRSFVRIPFGNVANRFMLNGMGLFNPHAESSYIRSSLLDYFIFYYRYVLRTQPFLLLTWFWSALVTLVFSLGEGLLPAMTDPLTIDERVKGIARRANATPSIVWSLREVHAHPAIYNPYKILRELWLDRAIILGLILFGSFQFFSTLNVFVQLSIWWAFAPLALLLPIFIFYARSVESEVAASQRAALSLAPIAARITQVARVIQGHTHRETHCWIEGIEYLNTGTWSAAYHDVECTQAFGRKCLAWIKPSPTPAATRVAELMEWSGTELLRVPPENGSGSH